MPRISTIPTLYNDARTVSISDLKKWGYLEPESYKSGTIKWSSRGEIRARIGIAVYMGMSKKYLELDYTYGGEAVKYKVPIVSVESNLGKGKVLYFLCPATQKRCRKLYGLGKHFLHRSAFNAIYESQTYSRNNRALSHMAEIAFGSDKLYDELYSKYFKRFYAGKPTKRYLRLKKKIQKADRFSQQDIEGLYFGILPEMR
uniref:Uncharacterized protein n=1 Tax=Roseihalotalea indica TaxID=2867963 RepID=A0AA49GJ95_9BACT|nr:hypothetical protein K4G66_21995 [Tunicatimonas sp. TK19036]